MKQTKLCLIVSVFLLSMLNIACSDSGGSTPFLPASAKTGLLTYLGSEPTRSGTSTAGYDVVESPDGKHVYVSTLYAVSWYSKGSDGNLAWVGTYSNSSNIDEGTAIAISPDGEFVYVASGADDGIARFGRNESTGELTFIGMIAYPELDGPTCLAMSRDGATLYVGCGNGSSLSWFSRNDTTGALTYEGQIVNATYFDGLASITVSPSGNYILTAAYADDQITSYPLTSTGSVGTRVDSASTWLDGPNSIIVSPDGKNVYVAAVDIDRVLAYSFNDSTGEFTYIEYYESATAAWDGANDVAISRDGKHVYAVAEIANSITTFERDASDGTLTSLDTITDGTNLLDPAAVIVSRNRDNVYVACFDGDMVTSYQRD